MAHVGWASGPCPGQVCLLLSLVRCCTPVGIHHVAVMRGSELLSTSLLLASTLVLLVLVCTLLSISP